MVEQSEIFRKSPGTKYLWNCRSRLTLKDRVLYYTWVSSLGKKLTLVVPNQLQQQVIQMLHDSHVGGHFGRDKTIDRVKSSFLWYGCAKDIKIYVESCAICRTSKKLHKPPGLVLRTIRQAILWSVFIWTSWGHLLRATEGISMC